MAICFSLTADLINIYDQFAERSFYRHFRFRLYER